MKQLQIQVNGKSLGVITGTTVLDLLSYYKISPKVCAVELNGEILDRKDFSKIILKDKDKVEVIRMMGGG